LCSRCFFIAYFFTAHFSGHHQKSIMHQAVGKSIGGHTSKIHLAVDACGNPIEFMITAGNVNEIVVAPD
ncbi:IS5/IS1182 family transposase, partial [Kingella kingae]|nr:IS5/IS1182 family transposase [Kingella kingae]